MNALHQSLLNQILLHLSPLGLCWSNDTPGLAYTRDGKPFKSGLTGSSDILACIHGRFVAVEVKTGTGTLSTAQRRFRDAVLRSGGVFVEARSVEDVVAALAADGLTEVAV